MPAKLWSRSLVLLMAVNFCSALSFYLIMVKVTQYAVDVYGVSYAVAGTVQTAYVISALLARMVFGRRIDEWGTRKSIAVGSVANALASAAYLLPLPFGGLIGVRVLHGFGFAVLSGAAISGAALVIPRERYGEGIGYFSMMQALATGLGPFVAILVTNLSGSYGAMFASALVVSVVPLAVAPLLNAPEFGKPASAAGSGTGAAAGSGRGRRLRVSDFVQVSVLPLSAVQLLCYLGYAGIISFVTLYASDLGLDDAVGFYFIVYAAVILVSRPPVGRRVDRAGENSVIYWCFASLAAGFVVLAFARGAVMLLASAALIGFGIGATQSIIQAVIARDTPQTELGRANSTFMMSMDLGSGVGPVIIGSMISAVGYGGSYLALAVVAGVAGAVYHAVHGRKQATGSR